MSDDNLSKQRVSIVICGHVDAGKSTTTGRLIFELGGIEEREMEKLKKEAETLGKSSFAFAFYMDRQKEERERGVTISCTTKEFFTETKRYTIIDAPGHRDFIKNMISGASQADVALLMVPADGNFSTALAKGDHKAGEVTGQTRQHALLLNLLGCKQLIVGVNKMDCDLAGYKEERFIECRDEAINMLGKVGWKKSLATKDKNGAPVLSKIPIIPISGFCGDNLLSKSSNMPWWNGVKVLARDPEDLTKEIELEIDCLKTALDKFVQIPPRPVDKPMRTPISGVYKPKGAGDVVTGRVEQGKVEVKKAVVFLPTHTPQVPCQGTVFRIEMHHKEHEVAFPGDNVGLQIKGLTKANMPVVGDVMAYKDDPLASTPFGQALYFTSQVSVQSHPGELKPGYTPIAFVRTGRAPVKMAHVEWVIKKGQKDKVPLDAGTGLKSGDAALVTFVPALKFCVDSYKQCEGLGRIAIMDGNSVVMLGRVNDVKLIGDKALFKHFPAEFADKLPKAYADWKFE